MLKDLFAVHINFEQSHLVFPSLIEGAMALFALLIVWQRRITIVEALRHFTTVMPPKQWSFDARKLFGTLALLVVYFLVMPVLGRLFPNTGFGFLVSSWIYALLQSALFAPTLDRARWLRIAVLALVAPTLIWLLFSQVMNISLP